MQKMVGRARRCSDSLVVFTIILCGTVREQFVTDDPLSRIIEEARLRGMKTRPRGKGKENLPLQATL